MNDSHNIIEEIIKNGKPITSNDYKILRNTFFYSLEHENFALLSVEILNKVLEFLKEDDRKLVKLNMLRKGFFIRMNKQQQKEAIREEIAKLKGKK